MWVLNRTNLRWLAPMAAGALALVLTGCRRDEVTSYQTPKEDYAAIAKVAAAPLASGGREESLPHVHWDLPAGWQEKTGEQRMGAGSFRVEGEEGKFVDIRIIPLRGGAEIEERSVNMWRGELGLPELPVTAVKGDEVVEVAGLKGNLYDLKSEEARFLQKHKARTTAAIVPREGMLWFIKMTGEESMVAGQQQAFRNFLKSLQFHEGEHDEVSGATASGGADEGGEPSPDKWTIPGTWKQQTAGPMVLAAYTATKGDASADITVTAFPGDVGGMLANVNRWRGQVRLGPITAGDLAKEVKSIELAGGAKASAVDVTGTNPKTGKPGRLYGLVVPRGGKTWFYKMVGDSDVVAAETANLAEFAANAH